VFGAMVVLVESSRSVFRLGSDRSVGSGFDEAPQIALRHGRELGPFVRTGGKRCQERGDVGKTRGVTRVVGIRGVRLDRPTPGFRR
jgi:hypothetical protein